MYNYFWAEFSNLRKYRCTALPWVPALAGAILSWNVLEVQLGTGWSYLSHPWPYRFCVSFIGYWWRNNDTPVSNGCGLWISLRLCPFCFMYNAFIFRHIYIYNYFIFLVCGHLVIIRLHLVYYYSQIPSRLVTPVVWMVPLVHCFTVCVSVLGFVCIRHILLFYPVCPILTFHWTLFYLHVAAAVLGFGTSSLSFPCSQLMFLPAACPACLPGLDACR